MKNGLTEVELELMNILWRLKEGSVNDVLAELPTDRKLAYTSVSTILRILEQKKVLGSRKEGRGHIYLPKLSKTDYEASALKNIVNKVFDGTPVAMVRQLLDTNDLTKNDLKEIQKLLNERLGNK
jgi:predicted transcriptional regulator